jgi:hypothetical protein
MLGILANIARKVDRLGGSETSDETSADTAMDLMVYLAKYKTWILDQRMFQDQAAPVPGVLSDTPDAANEILLSIDGQPYREVQMPSQRDQEARLRLEFNVLESNITKNRGSRSQTVDSMLRNAYLLARYLWETRSVSDEYRGADVD